MNSSRHKRKGDFMPGSPIESEDEPDEKKIVDSEMKNDKFIVNPDLRHILGFLNQSEWVS